MLAGHTNSVPAHPPVSVPCLAEVAGPALTVLSPVALAGTMLSASHPLPVRDYRTDASPPFRLLMLPLMLVLIAVACVLQRCVLCRLLVSGFIPDLGSWVSFKMPAFHQWWHHVFRRHSNTRGSRCDAMPS